MGSVHWWRAVRDLELVIIEHLFVGRCALFVVILLGGII